MLQLSRVGDLLGTSADTLSHALTHKAVAVSDTTSDVTEMKRSILQACHTRDTLAKVFPLMKHQIRYHNFEHALKKIIPSDKYLALPSLKVPKDRVIFVVI